MHKDECASCGIEFYLLPQHEDYRLFIFLETPMYNSVQVRCPECHNVNRLFAETDAILGLLEDGLKLTICKEATDDVMEGYWKLRADETMTHEEKFQVWCIENATDDELRRELGL